MNWKELFDEVQETIMIIGALVLWGVFEYICLTNQAVSTAENIGITRQALITIVTNLFTYKFTKSLPKGGRNNGG